MRINAFYLAVVASAAFLSSARAVELSPANQGSVLEIYVYPPLKSLNWKSPRGLFESFATTAVERSLGMNADVKFESDFGEMGHISSRYKSSMGHTIGHMDCQLSNGERYDHWASFSGQDFSEVDKRNLIKEKLGMGVLFYDFIDGHIISGEENKMRLTYYSSFSGKRPRYMQVAIDSQKCDELKKMVTFFEGFHFEENTPLTKLEAKAKNPDDVLYFSSVIDPYQSYIDRMNKGSGKVGGGCAPFGAALLKVAGRFDPIFDKVWRRPLSVSEKLIGGIPDENGNIRRVSVGELVDPFGKLGRHWTFDGYANRDLNLYDPTLIWNFIGEVEACLKKRTDKHCSAAAAEWLDAHPGQVSEGEKHRFSHTLLVKRQQGPHNDVVEVNETRKTDIRGIVVSK